MPAANGLEFSVVACNLAGLCSNAETISLPMDAGRKLSVAIVGLPATIIASARVNLASKVNYSECGTAKLPFNISVKMI